MGYKEIRHLKKCIREGIREINNNNLKDIGDMESLMRWTGWVNRDANNLIKEWKKSR